MLAPRRVARISRHVAIVAGIGSVITLAAWAGQGHPGHRYTHLVMMVYQAQLAVTLGAVVLHVGARIQATTAEAFGHGVTAGKGPPPPHRRHLRGLD